MGVQERMVEKACKGCKRIVESARVCPNCDGSPFSEDWKGYVIIIDPSGSAAAEELDVDTPGRYALMVR